MNDYNFRTNKSKLTRAIIYNFQQFFERFLTCNMYIQFSFAIVNKKKKTNSGKYKKNWKQIMKINNNVSDVLLLDMLIIHLHIFK